MLLLSTNNNNNNAFVRLAFMPFKATTFLRTINTTYRPIKAAQPLCIPPSTSNRNNQTSVTITQAVLSPNTLPELTDNPLFPQRQVFQPVWGKIGIFSAGIYQQFPPPSNSCSTHPTSSSHIPHPTSHILTTRLSISIHSTLFPSFPPRESCVSPSVPRATSSLRASRPHLASSALPPPKPLPKPLLQRTAPETRATPVQSVLSIRHHPKGRRAIAPKPVDFPHELGM